MRASTLALGLAAFAASAPAHADDDLIHTASIVVVGDRPPCKRRQAPPLRLNPTIWSARAF